MDCGWSSPAKKKRRLLGSETTPYISLGKGDTAKEIKKKGEKTELAMLTLNISRKRN